MAQDRSTRKLRSQLQGLGRWPKGMAGVICLFLAYAVVSRALDTGSWWEYGATLVLLVIGFRSIIAAFKSNK